MGQLDLFNNRYYPIVVIFDRENRTETADTIICNLKDKLAELEVDVSQLIIGVPDRTIESWILPFIDENGKFPELPQKIPIDSPSEDDIVERFEKNGMQYEKTKNGVELFC